VCGPFPPPFFVLIFDFIVSAAGLRERGFTCVYGGEDLAARCLFRAVWQEEVPLHEAARTCSVETARAILDAHPEYINAVSKYGCTPIKEAADRGRTDMVQLFLSRGANPRMRSISGMSATDWAAQSGRLETLNVLLAYEREMLRAFAREQEACAPNARRNAVAPFFEVTASSCFLPWPFVGETALTVRVHVGETALTVRVQRRRAWTCGMKLLAAASKTPRRWRVRVPKKRSACARPTDDASCTWLPNEAASC
jgi:hypothetical protein